MADALTVTRVRPLYLMPVEDRPTCICLRCGSQAVETVTSYGIRSDCCGMWSWNRMPLADAATHAIRRELAPLMKQIGAELTTPVMYSEIRRRTGIRQSEDLVLSMVNEATAIKMKAAVEDILMDMMAGKAMG